MGADTKLLELIGDASGLLEIAEFHRGLIRALRRAVPASWIAINDVGPDPASITALTDPEADPELFKLFAQFAYQNPLIQYYNATRDGRTCRMSDLVTQDQFHSLELYQQVYRPMRVEYQLAFTLPHVKDRVLGISMNRERDDFTDAECELIERARPYLIQAYRNATLYTELLEAAYAPPPGRTLPAVESLQALGLTRRQAQALQLLATGAAERDIASQLGISDRTVQKHLQLCYRALGVSSRSAAAAIAWSTAT